MNIKHTCQHCFNTLEIPERFAGQTGRCAKCGQPITLPPLLKPVPRWKLGVLWGFLGLMLVGFIGSLLDKPEPKHRPEMQPVAITAEAVEPEPEPEPAQWVDVTFDEMRYQMENATSLQWESYRNSLTGKRVTWRGWVQNSKKTLFSGYEVQIDMDPPEVAISVSDVYAEVPESVARAMSMDQEIYFTGTVESMTNVLGSLAVRLVDVQVQ